ncbi:hypothetical protein ID866_10465 [Astraeus odoratus]|nr:hypothetical protein ID866_10465 [Astraeus odoratus]
MVVLNGMIPILEDHSPLCTKGRYVLKELA